MNLTHSEPQGHLGQPVSSATASRPLDVVVIGAGQAGLAMAWYLARRGVRYLLIDSNPKVGAAWRGRWDSLRLFSPAQYDGLPGSDFPAAADTYPGKDDVADFLASYAERNAPVAGPDGRPRHDHGRSQAAAGLWFLGLPWQRNRGSSLLGFVQRDAAHLDTQMFSRTLAR